MYCNDCHILLVVYRPNEGLVPIIDQILKIIKKYETQILFNYFLS